MRYFILLKIPYKKFLSISFLFLIFYKNSYGIEFYNQLNVNYHIISNKFFGNSFLRQIMYIYRLEEENKVIIYIEGRIDSVEKMLSLVPELDYTKRKVPFSKRESVINDYSEMEELVLDFERLEFISDECLQLFSKLKSIYNIKFRNSSLYIEMKLKEYKLFE